MNQRVDHTPDTHETAPWSSREGAVVLWRGPYIDAESVATVAEAARTAPVTVLLNAEDAVSGLHGPLTPRDRCELVEALRDVRNVALPDSRAWSELRANACARLWTVPYGAATFHAETIDALAARGETVRIGPRLPGRDAESLAARIARDEPTPRPGAALPGIPSVGSRVLDADCLGDVVAAFKRRRRRIVTVNGCFDLIHPGHTRFLHAAAREGDCLFVLINDDASVRRYKGDRRPFVDQGARTAVLASLRPVDHVVVFEGDNPLALLDLIRPDTHCKGGTYEPDRAAEEKALVECNGGSLRFLPMVGDYSSTALAQKARRAE